ncbi:unnamed protein product [Phytomonas sp. EM1]|nr:unnamed protein product [Phytomonas sp. EM1]|eukprot:CCW59969.1 unnamed protein product [Phytomonas sp. isolate EM1]
MANVVKKRPLPARILNNAENGCTIKKNNSNSSGSILPSGSSNSKHGSKSFSISSSDKVGGTEVPKPYLPGSTKLYTPTTRNVSGGTPLGRTSTTLKRRKRKKRHTTANLEDPARIAALKVIRTLFLPLVLKKVLGRRRIKAWKGSYPPRNHTTDSVVSALSSSNETLLPLPPEMIHLLAQEATFFYLLPKEPIVYFNESHLSCGIVVLLHGQLVERRPDSGGPGGKPQEWTAARRLSSPEYVRTRYAPEVLCTVPVLCEDRSCSSFACGPSETADVAVISSRWFWKVFAHFAVGSPQSEMLLKAFRERVIPIRTEILLMSYYPSPVLLRRSWIGLHLSKKDRLKLCSEMRVMVLGVGDVLFNAGDSCRYIYFLRRGTLTIVVKEKPLANFGPGAAFGEASALFGDPWNCTAIANSVCELYAVSLQVLNQLLEQTPTLAKDLFERAFERRKQWMEEGRERGLFGLIHLLGGVPCLSHTTEAMRREIARRAVIVSVPSGHKLAQRNTPCECLYVIARGFTRVVRFLDSDPQHQAPVPAVDEVRGVGDFLGELCLRPHCWPTDVFCETSVDVWVFRREAILEILSAARADAQAGVVCRQGIDLYRAQFGEQSILEVYDGIPDTTDTPLRRRTRSSLSLPSSEIRSSSARKRPHTTSLRTLVNQTRESLEEFDWVDYARRRRQRAIADAELTASEETYAHRSGDQSWMSAVEKAMGPKACSLISVPPDLAPNPVDCDFPGELDELQTVVVEQLLLSPSEDHERFLRQLNESSVMLVTATVSSDNVFRASSVIEDSLSVGKEGILLPEDEFLHEVVGPTGDAYLFGIENLKEPEHLDSSKASMDEVDSANNRSLPFNPDLYTPICYNNSESSGNDSLLNQPQQSSVLEERKSSLVSALHPLNMSVSRSRHARSQSALLMSSLKGALGISIDKALSTLGRVQSSSIVGSDLATPGHGARSSSDARLGSAMTILKSSNVDYAQYTKHSTEKSSSILDRLVKIKDQNYFSTFVKVMPISQDDFWLPGESDDSVSQDLDQIPFVLVLMQVIECNHLDPTITSSCAEPFVKVSVGERVLLRTTSFKDLVHPTWPVETSTFISLLKRKSVIRFEICDRQEESRVLYACSFAMESTHERGGVGKCGMRLTSPSSSPVEASDGHADPRMTVAMIVITTANYAALEEHCRGEVDTPIQERPSGATSLLLVGVRGLKHRVSASIHATLRQDGTLVEFLKTPMNEPKTRAPSWRPQEAFVTIQPNGVIRFDLLHKTTSIASCELTAEELVFGGVGLRHLSLLAAREKGKVMGELLVYVLSTFLPTPVESRIPEKVLFLYVEKVSISKAKMASSTTRKMSWGFNVEPDPFVVIRNADGKVVLRTPLVCASCEASWSAEDASCFLPFPDLSGSKALYRLELYDNEEVKAQLIDQAVFAVGRDGLSTNGLFDIALRGMRAAVRLHAFVLPAEGRLLNRPRAGSPRAVHFSQDELLVLLHVVRFHDDATLAASAGTTAAWAKALWRRLQPDVVVRLKVHGREFLRTPHGSFRERWPIHDAGVVLRLDARVIPSDSMAVFEVFEGIVNEADKVGEVQLPLRELCTSGNRLLSVFSSRPEMVYLSTHCIGKLELKLFCGILGSQVFTHDPAFQRLVSFQNQKYSTADKAEADDLVSTIVNKGNSRPYRFMNTHVRLRLISLSNFPVETDCADEHMQLVVKMTLGDQEKRLLLHTQAVPILAESINKEHNGLSAVWEVDDETIVEIDIGRLQSRAILVYAECDACSDPSKSKSSPVAEEKVNAVSDKNPFRRVLCGSIPSTTLASATIDRIQVDTVELIDTLHLPDTPLSLITDQKSKISEKLETRGNSKPYLSFSFIAVGPPLGSDSTSEPSSSGIFIYA